MFYATALIVFSYLLGSIPFGLLIGKAFYKTDIREHGSRNIGATNAFRILGPPAGAAVFLADLMKGLIPVMLAKYAVPLNPDTIPLVGVLSGISAILGHSYSIFMRFSGGKGMSTAGGFVLALWPKVGLILIIIWATILISTKYSSVASLTIAIMLPVLVTILYPKPVYIGFAVAVTVVLVYRHRSNIARLMAGKELKLGQKASMEED
ncbi:MAG: glycerol-3-phosphate 1-O-acyltransferase PlsY [Firmicutes bacterium]|nr:glycerol-3-phosphate 1-O-acyltransferase PlsY [Bacillota bacterium]